MKTQLKKQAGPEGPVQKAPPDELFIELAKAALSGVASQFEVYGRLSRQERYPDQPDVAVLHDWDWEQEERAEQLAKRAFVLARCMRRLLAQELVISEFNQKVTHAE